jgi:hypothetical protein
MLTTVLPADETPVTTGLCRSENCSEAPMREFSKRDMLIFVVCLMLGAVLIGLGMAYVIQLKQRISPSGQTAKPSEVRSVLCVSHPCRFDAGIVGKFQLARKMKIAGTATVSRENPSGRPDGFRIANATLGFVLDN